MFFFVAGSGLIPVLSRFITVPYLGFDTAYQFVKCLKYLPNLHTVEIGSSGTSCDARWLKMALMWQVVFPQIKTLIIPKDAYPLLRHCPNVEDIVWVIVNRSITSDKFLRSLPPSWRSKVKRLMIPLVSPVDPSRR